MASASLAAVQVLYHCIQVTNLGIICYIIRNNQSFMKQFDKMIAHRNEVHMPLVLCTAIVLLLQLVPSATRAEDNIEIDALVNRFQSGIGSISGKLGQASPEVEGQSDVASLEREMRELYTNLERGLTEARQKVANERSTVISERIAQLKLI